jgi:hypothetical protein
MSNFIISIVLFAVTLIVSLVAGFVLVILPWGTPPLSVPNYVAGFVSGSMLISVICFAHWPSKGL